MYMYVATCILGDKSGTFLPKKKETLYFRAKSIESLYP